MHARILVVDDEPVVRDVLTRYLKRDGFEVESVADGEQALESIATNPPDLVLLDLMLPKVDGFEVFGRMRTFSDAAVIMLTAKGGETDRIAGLELGADDYVNKPFSPKEVALRVKAVLRRAGEGSDSSGGERFDFGELIIDGRSRQAFLREREVTLTPKEFDLLYLLASQRGRAFTRLQLLEELWDFAFDGDPSTVTVHVRRLREKIEDDPSNPTRLVTVWGTGYRFDA
jgi:two-component system, OmpR family, response regulator ResD